MEDDGLTLLTAKIIKNDTQGIPNFLQPDHLQSVH